MGGIVWRWSFAVVTVLCFLWKEISCGCHRVEGYLCGGGDCLGLSPTSAKPGKPICKMLIGPMAPRHNFSNLNPYENTTGPITKRNLERHKGISQI